MARRFIPSLLSNPPKEIPAGYGPSLFYILLNEAPFSLTFNVRDSKQQNVSVQDKYDKPDRRTVFYRHTEDKNTFFLKYKNAQGINI